MSFDSLYQTVTHMDNPIAFSRQCLVVRNDYERHPCLSREIEEKAMELTTIMAVETA